METICALIRGDLAPAGNRISLQNTTELIAYPLSGYFATWVDSGTSALAIALADIKAKAPLVKNPKVIIPGYCCPDLVAAAVYAGLKPLVVDIDIDDAGYDLAALKDAIDEDVAAIIAVNFLGVSERLADIRAIISSTNIKLVEDNAQWFPEKESADFLSDYVVFSFGRGKPLSLLGGGVVFSKIDIVVAELIGGPALPTLFGSAKQRIKFFAYNLLLRPHLYCFLNRFPFFRLGETKYHALMRISAMDDFRKALFAVNSELYVGRGKATEQAYDESSRISKIQRLTSLSTERRKKLLRYPLLCADSHCRDKVLSKLSALGLGASPLYQRVISEIPDVDGLIEIHGKLNNASSFAGRLITLPTHENVLPKHLRRINRAFEGD